MGVRMVAAQALGNERVISRAHRALPFGATTCPISRGEPVDEGYLKRGASDCRQSSASKATRLNCRYLRAPGVRRAVLMLGSSSCTHGFERFHTMSEIPRVKSSGTPGMVGEQLS